MNQSINQSITDQHWPNIVSLSLEPTFQNLSSLGMRLCLLCSWPLLIASILYLAANPLSCAEPSFSYKDGGRCPRSNDAKQKTVDKIYVFIYREINLK